MKTRREIEPCTLVHAGSCSAFISFIFFASSEASESNGAFSPRLLGSILSQTLLCPALVGDKRTKGQLEHVLKMYAEKHPACRAPDNQPDWLHAAIAHVHRGRIHPGAKGLLIRHLLAPSSLPSPAADSANTA